MNRKLIAATRQHMCIPTSILSKMIFSQISFFFPITQARKHNRNYKQFQAAAYDRKLNTHVEKWKISCQECNRQFCNVLEFLECLEFLAQFLMLSLFCRNYLEKQRGPYLKRLFFQPIVKDGNDCVTRANISMRAATLRSNNQDVNAKLVNHYAAKQDRYYTVGVCVRQGTKC